MNMPTTSHKCIFFWNEETLEDPMELFHLLNSIDNKIKFTIEMGESIPFLDILFTLVENSIMETDIYYKPTDTIMYSSGASTRIKLSPIYPSHSRSRFALLFQRRTLENSVSGNWRVFCWRKSTRKPSLILVFPALLSWTGTSFWSLKHLRRMMHPRPCLLSSQITVATLMSWTYYGEEWISYYLVNGWLP